MFGQIERWIPLARLPVFRPHCLNSNCWIWEEQSGTKFNFSDSILQWNLYGKDLHLHWELVKRLFSNYWITSYCPFIIIIYDYYYYYYRSIGFWLHRNGFFLWFAFQVDSSSLEIFGFCNINFFSLSLLFHSPPPLLFLLTAIYILFCCPSLSFVFCSPKYASKHLFIK